MWATIERAEHPFSLVLHSKGGALLAALSATMEGLGGKEAFLPDDVPLLATALPEFRGPTAVASVDPQPNAAPCFEDSFREPSRDSTHPDRARRVARYPRLQLCRYDREPASRSPTSQFSVFLRLPTGQQSMGALITPSAGSQPNMTSIQPVPTPTLVGIAVTFAGVPLDSDFDAWTAPL